MDHQNKKYPCKPIHINTRNSTVTPQISTQFSQFKQTHKDKRGQFNCTFCGKSLSRQDSLSRHLDNCKVKKEDDENKKNIFELLLEKERKEKELLNNQLKLQNNQIQSQQKEMTELKKHLLDLTKTIKDLSLKTSTVINNNYGNVNNIVIPSDKLSKFGKEDLTKITNNEFLKIKNYQGVAIFMETAKLIYNNKSVNKTVYISDVSRRKAMIFDGQSWILHDLNEVIKIMKEKVRDFYNLKLGNLEDEKILKDFENRIQKYYEMLYDEYDEDKADDKKFMERAKSLQDKFEKDLIKWLFNIKKQVIDNYNVVLELELVNNKKHIEDITQTKQISFESDLEIISDTPKKTRRGRPKK